MTTKKRRGPSHGELLRRRGFDETYYNRSQGTYRVRCSQCQALVINGVATHESGCPNRRRARNE